MSYQNLAISKELHRQAKVAASEEGITLIAWAERALRRALDGDNGSEYREQALAALEVCGPGASKTQLLNQINYARGRLLVDTRQPYVTEEAR